MAAAVYGYGQVGSVGIGECAERSVVVGHGWEHRAVDGVRDEVGVRVCARASGVYDIGVWRICECGGRVYIERVWRRCECERRVDEQRGLGRECDRGCGSYDG